MAFIAIKNLKEDFAGPQTVDALRPMPFFSPLNMLTLKIAMQSGCPYQSMMTHRANSTVISGASGIHFSSTASCLPKGAIQQLIWMGHSVSLQEIQSKPGFKLSR